MEKLVTRDVEDEINSFVAKRVPLNKLFDIYIEGKRELDGVVAEMKRSHEWEKDKKHALTEAQQSAFIE